VVSELEHIYEKVEETTLEKSFEEVVHELALPYLGLIDHVSLTQLISALIPFVSSLPCCFPKA